MFVKLDTRPKSHFQCYPLYIVIFYRLSQKDREMLRVFLFGAALIVCQGQQTLDDLIVSVFNTKDTGGPVPSPQPELQPQPHPSPQPQPTTPNREPVSNVRSKYTCTLNANLFLF